MYVGSDGGRSRRSSLGAMKTLVAVYDSNMEFMNLVKYTGVGGLRLSITILL